jgi:hypothetical protein
LKTKRSIRQHHDEWLGLLERSGPFLTVPVLAQTWPAGLDPVPAGTMEETRPAFAAWAENPAGGQRAWITFVLSEMLEWGDSLAQGPDLPDGYSVMIPEHATSVRADFAFRAPDGAMRLLGMVLPPGMAPTARVPGGWAASPADRLAILLRRHEVELGLATDGRWWALVWAPAEGVTSTTVWDGALWMEERETLAAFRCLLERRRFLGVSDAETLPALLAAGLDQQEEITETLGRQVREAVEMLVEAIGRAGRQGGPAERLLADIEPDEVYHAAVTVMMRLLFLLFAEEKLLLPADSELYAESYSAGRLVDSLREEANLDGEETLEHRTAAWQRLLSVFRAVHRGIGHDQLRIPAYGGVVFDPDQHPWLEGRGEGSEGDTVLPIDDRTVLHALEALQYVRIGDERRRLTFRTLDVEEIGYVYEGLLGYDAVQAMEPVVGLVGKAGEEAEMSLSELEVIASDVGELAERMGISETRIGRLLAEPDDLHREQLLRIACSGDDALLQGVRPFASLLRPDLRGLPVIIPAGGLYATVSPRRRLSGTHYTPRDLAEKVVVRALEPLVYSPGPLETDDRAEWRRRSSEEILGLKVVDIAMGSGAFLVAACRYLAGKLIEAWADQGDVRAVVHLIGDQDLPIDPESDPVVIDARRQVIEHCLYGGDINDMAVEMAKLSLWLVSLSRERPFSFLDDRLTCGDSLLGLTSFDQLRTLHLDPDKARRRAGERGFDIWGDVKARLDAVEGLRRDIAARPLVDVRDAEIKKRLLETAQVKARPLAVLADAIVGVAMASAGGHGDLEEGLLRLAQAARGVLADGDEANDAAGLLEVAESAAYQLNTDRPEGAFERKPTHWPLVFPEVFEGGGFDAVIGNPPFLGGQKLTGAFGVAYREYLVRQVADGARGSADLLAYFLLIAYRLLRERGQTGLIGTNTMAQGDTREVGLDQVIAEGASIRAAVKSARWPTRTVNLEYSILWATPWKLGEEVGRYLEDERVPLITSSLDASETDAGPPLRLAANQGIAFQGSNVLGMGFTMSREQAEALIDRDPRNSDVLSPYINGEDLNSRPDTSASRWVINFFDWPLERAEQYAECIDIVRRLVKPERDRVRRAARRERWWQFAERAPGLYRAIAGLGRVLAIAQTSRTMMPAWIAMPAVPSHTVVVFAWDDASHFALLCGAFHQKWAFEYGATMRTDPRYTPSDIFLTFPRPANIGRLASLGEMLESVRHPLMSYEQIGLTRLYNRVHHPDESDAGIRQLRDIHVEIDEAVAEAYGWDELGLEHGFHETPQGVRFTISENARREALGRLLELNHTRHAEEEAQGLAHSRGGSQRRGPAGQMSLIER